MTISHSVPPVASGASGVSSRLLMPLFATTLCLSAFLLFSIQPFFTKMLLPRLGGTPAVWSVAMVFFQAVLLCGYAYAHLLARFATVKIGAAIHAVVLLSAFVVLPIGIAAGWDQPPATGQSLWLLGLLTVSVGLPFFAVSANGALLQAWFAKTDHPQAADPYFLYGASNIGSFASLILYIVMIEPLLTLGGQSIAWTVGYAVLVAAIMSCALMAMGNTTTSVRQARDSVDTKAVASAGTIVSWILLGALPSGLLVAVTAHITTDVAAAPFLWVVPLALFLLTFVFAFRSKPILTLRTLSLAVPPLGAAALLLLFFNPGVAVWASLLAHLFFFFFAALFCHSLLYSMRPASSGLTGFYLAMSFGGVVGGAFASLLAPTAFNWVTEYPILIAAVLLLRSGKGVSVVDVRWAVMAIAVAVVAALLPAPATPHALVAVLVVISALIAFTRLRWEPIYMALVCAIMPLTLLYQGASKELFRDRSFFGIVGVGSTDDGQFNKMWHGTTLHGAEQMTDASGSPITGRPTPLTYYHPKSAMAMTIKAAQTQFGPAGAYGVVGLGAGSVACYAQPQEDWRFYEIDQSVVDAARDPKLFRFMSDCGAQMPVVLGDARLTLAKETPARFDYLLIDAFSSDAIPTHLMTVEALDLFQSRVKDGGVLAFHIFNRYLELPSVLAAITAKLDLPLRVGRFLSDPSLPNSASSVVAMMTRNPAMLAELDKDERWSKPEAGSTAAWTDDYSNVFAALLRGQLSGVARAEIAK